MAGREYERKGLMSQADSLMPIVGNLVESTLPGDGGERSTGARLGSMQDAFVTFQDDRDR